jgi:hypothetical protein
VVASVQLWQRGPEKRDQRHTVVVLVFDVELDVVP